MYWQRIDSPFPLLAWLLLIMLCWLGGWLITTHLFRLRSRERLLTGLAVSFLLLIVLVNVLAPLIRRVIPEIDSGAALTISFWGAGAFILGLGILARYTARKPDGRRLELPFRDNWIDKEDFGAWPQLLGVGGLLLLFILINRGLAIFDDYHNLPLVSTIAAGDLPPHFYLDSQVGLAYHYGLHLFAASLVRIAGQFPWSAFDLGKSFTIALTIVLAWLWFRRVTHRANAAYWGTLLITFAGGTRWLLLLFPAGLLQQMGAGLNLLGSALATGSDLYTVMLSHWKIEGGGPLPFPFAFTNSIHSSLNMALGGSGAAPILTILVLLLLSRRAWRPLEGMVFGLVLASLALTAEHVCAMVLVGIFIAAGWMIISASLRRGTRQTLVSIAGWAWVLLPALGLGLLAGGVITETLAGLFGRGASTIVEEGTRVGGLTTSTFIGLRWPPAITSSHFGPLAITNPWQLMIGFAEVGVAVLLAPLAGCWSFRQIRRGDWPPAWIMIGSIVLSLLSLFIYYQRAERDTSRLLGSALSIWILLAFPIISILWKKMNRGVRTLFIAGYAATILSGIVLFSIQMIAIIRPQFTYFVDTPDAILSQKYWDNLEQDAQIFDLDATRAVTLFGRPMRHAFQDQYTPFSAWLTLEQNLDPTQIAQAGFSYIYLDKETWQNLTYQQKQNFQQPCVSKFAEQVTEEKDFRWILDIRTCK